MSNRAYTGLLAGALLLSTIALAPAQVGVPQTPGTGGAGSGLGTGSGGLGSGTGVGAGGIGTGSGTLGTGTGGLGTGGIGTGIGGAGTNPAPGNPGTSTGLGATPTTPNVPGPGPALGGGGAGASSTSSGVAPGTITEQNNDALSPAATRGRSSAQARVQRRARAKTARRVVRTKRRHRVYRYGSPPPAHRGIVWFNTNYVPYFCQSSNPAVVLRARRAGFACANALLGF